LNFDFSLLHLPLDCIFLRVFLQRALSDEIAVDIEEAVFFETAYPYYYAGAMLLGHQYKFL